MWYKKNIKWFKGYIEKMVRDDDIDYTILGLHCLEENGINLISEDIAKQWLDHLPYNSVFTAEKVAYKNLVNGILPPESGKYHNPYREWIGAQIRADIWGYITPGCPEKAAEYAYKDASVSHIKNGTYGEMFVSAMLSASFIENDINRIIEIGLSEIPEKCRLNEAVKNVIKWSKGNKDWKDTWNNIMKLYGKYNWVHTINNAAIVVMGLLYGKKDFEKSICITVMGGLDTDCNGATVGSILGVILGKDKLPNKWIKPLNNIVVSAVFGFPENKISDLAKKTFNISRRYRNEI